MVNMGTKKGRFRRLVRPLLLGYLVAAACLVWVFHDTHADRLLDQMAGIHWAWIALAMAFDVLSYFCQGWRWQLLLRPVGRVSLLETTEAIYVGLFANEIMPLRVGEPLRAYLLSRQVSLPPVRVIPSMAVERLFDGIWLAAGLGLTALFVPLPKILLEAGDILAVVVLVGAGLFAHLAFRGTRGSTSSMTSPLRLRAALVSLWTQMVEGLREIGVTRASFFAFLISFLVVSFQALAFWLVMWGYGLKLSLWVGTAVFLIVHLGTAIPNAPANIGAYQFFTVAGLALFGVGKTLASGFSVVVFILLTAPLWAIGALALAYSGTTLAAVRAGWAQQPPDPCPVIKDIT